MGLLDIFKGKKKQSLEKDKVLIEAGACPNCWGTQEYEGQIKEVLKDKEKDVLNKDHRAQQAFIQKFVQKNIKGIRLKKDGDKQICPACKSRYKIVRHD